LPRGQRLSQLAAEAAGAPTPAAALRTLRALRRELDEFERRQVALALAEGASFAAVARDLGLSRQAVHRRYRELSGPAALASPDVRRILRLAREEAAALGGEAMGGEHLVLAALRAPDLPAGAALRAAGVTLERARMRLRGAARRPRTFHGALDAQALLAAPSDRAPRRGPQRLEVEHLLLAALDDPDGGASRLLRALAVDPVQMRAHLGALAAANPSAGVNGR
jgi:ATP-dependent Clp protease ATP-binding subunit ClpA